MSHNLKILLQIMFLNPFEKDVLRDQVLSCLLTQARGGVVVLVAVSCGTCQYLDAAAWNGGGPPSGAKPLRGVAPGSIFDNFMDFDGFDAFST